MLEPGAPGEACYEKMIDHGQDFVNELRLRKLMRLLKLRWGFKIRGGPRRRSLAGRRPPKVAGGGPAAPVGSPGGARRRLLAPTGLPARTGGSRKFKGGDCLET